MASRWTTRRPLLVGAIGALSLAAACADPFDTTRSPPPRGTLGEELFGVLCDRVGAQALHEDLTGGSYHAVCHKDASGNWASNVDQAQLPGADPNAVDVNGNPVTVDLQNANRAHAVARVEAMARRRADLVSALDTTFPDEQVPVKDLANADPTQTCNAPAGTGTRRLHDELTDLLGRFQGLYDDGTIPQSTESLARIFDAIKATPDAQSALARFEARQGYRPIELGLGAARPIIAWSGLRDFANASLALLASDSQPYAKDPNGNHTLIPGPANAQFKQLISVAHDELAFATQDPTPAKLLPVTDAALERTILARPYTDLEVLEKLFYAHSDSFGRPGAKSMYIATRDASGFARVHPIGSVAVPPPFVDDGTGSPKIDDLGRFVTTDGQPPPSPFFAIGQPLGTRDACGRAMRGGAAPVDGGASGGSSDAAPASSDAGGPATSDPCAQLDKTDPDVFYYDTVEMQHAFAASLLKDLKPLSNPDPNAKHETLMYALAGAPVLFGARDGSAKTSKCYLHTDPKNPQSTCADGALLNYDAFHTDSSALLDLVYAIGQMMGDPTMDDTLHYVSALFQNHLDIVARLAGDGLDMKAIADKHPEAHIPAKSTFWDEMIDVTVAIEADKTGLLEDVLRALGADPSAQLGQIFANYMTFKDRLSYDPNNLNGPPVNLEKQPPAPGDMNTPVDRTQADTGFNRSAMQRFLQLVHDTNGATACNKEGAVVHAKGIPLLGSADICSGGLCSLGSKPFKECEVFKIDNLAKFYLDSIVGKGNLYFRAGILRNGILGIGAATVDLIEQSSGIGLNANDTYGFWDDTSAKTFRPRPQWLNRLVFFDQANDTRAPTQQFLADLQGPHIGSSTCPERIIPDPCVAGASGVDCAGAPDVASDGKVHGLRNCPDGQWLDQQGKDTIFVWEQFGFYQAITPLLSAFVNHNREDLFIELMEVLYRHWADDKGTPQECLLSSDPNAKFQQCTKDGVVTYEPLVAEDFGGDILPALHDLEKVLELQADDQTIKHCTAMDPNNPKICGAQQKMDGIGVLSAATRGLLDPDQATAIGLKDRHGSALGMRNDGTANAQVTPIYLLTQALNGMDAAFNGASKPNDDRLAQWRTARSQLVDQFLKVDHTGTTFTFDNPAVPAIAPTLIDVLRAQLYARCPTTFSPPYKDRCGWARDDMTNEMATVMSGPTFAAAMDLLEAVRTDPASRAQMGALLQYLLDAASQNDALPSVLASANDMIQLMKDDTNLVPLYHALAPALEASTDASQLSVVDAQLALLGRISGRAMDANGKEICSSELDPNQVLTIALKNLVTPMTTPDGQTGLAPLQIVMDVIGDVNRADPAQQTKFASADYASIADNVSDFLLNKERGLEQFYAIVRNGTQNQ